MAISASETTGQRRSCSMGASAPISKLFQVGSDGGIQLRGLDLLLAQHRGEPLHLLLERLAVVLGGLGTDVPSGCEHMAMLADVIELCGLAETRHVGVLARVLVATPGVIGAGNLGKVVVSQLAVR